MLIKKKTKKSNKEEQKNKEAKKPKSKRTKKQGTKETEEQKSREAKKRIIEELQKQLSQCRKEKEQYLSGWQRARADFLNYKKQELERLNNASQSTMKEFIAEILPILDSFERAKKEIAESDMTNKSIQGFLQIKNQLIDFLEKQGVEKITITQGQKFDPYVHEAVEIVQDSKKEEGTVLEEVQTGYKIHNYILRPSKVKVTKVEKKQVNQETKRLKKQKN